MSKQPSQKFLRELDEYLHSPDHMRETRIVTLETQLAAALAENQQLLDKLKYYEQGLIIHGLSKQEVEWLYATLIEKRSASAQPTEARSSDVWDWIKQKTH